MTAPRYRQCVRCVMDTTDPEIRFDARGVCNHCSDQMERMRRLEATGRAGQQHLPAAIDALKRAGRGREYDALLGISGGIDSTYLALFLRQQGVRTLLVHMDNGWDTVASVRNIRNVAATTGFDYESYVLDWEEFRGLQLAFLRASVVEAETPTDMAIAGALFRIAKKHGIRYIVSASNEASEGILPHLWHYDRKDIRYLRAVNRRFGQGELRHFPLFGLTREFRYKVLSGIRSLYLLNYLDYDRSAALATLKAALDWEEYGGKHHESLFTKFVQSFLLPRKFDLDYRKATFSSLICAGRMTREAAIEQLAQPPYDPADIAPLKDYIARKLRIPVDELDRIIDLPGRYYTDYPNNERWLSLAYRLYRLLPGKRPAPAAVQPDVLDAGLPLAGATLPET